MNVNTAALNDADKKLNGAFVQLKALLTLLDEKALPDRVVSGINSEVAALNASALTGKPLYKQLRQKQSVILRLVEKEAKIVPLHYYRNIWFALGMSAFGLPIGVAIGLSLGNMAFLGIGLPIGLCLGLAVGTAMDKKAKAAGRQLDIAIV